MRKNEVPCHAFADKLFVDWLSRGLWQLEKEKLVD